MIGMMDEWSIEKTWENFHYSIIPSLH